MADSSSGAGAAAAEGGGSSAQYKVPYHGKDQIVESLSTLDSKKAASIDHTTDIRVAAGDREAQRRIAEEKRRQDRLWRLQEEAVASNKANAAVEMKWHDLKFYNMPQELHEELQKQRAACARIVASKDQLTREFLAEIKAKDEEYVRTIASQAEDVETLITRMNEQFTQLQAAYDGELGSIEEAYAQEHQALMDAHRAEMDELFGVRKRMETTLVEERLAREAAYQAELDAMQSKDAEQYTKLKVKLESDVQVLEQQLELMRSTYALNMEKLEYNFRVLSEKDTENEIAESQQKEKIKSLDRALTKVMRDYVAADKAFKAENAALTREYQRITRQYQDLQAKFSHFEAADQAKFRSVWDMHEEEVQQMLQRALAADRVISEQLLGWEWHPPTATVPRPAAALGGGTSPRHQQGQTPAGAAAAARAAAAGGGVAEGKEEGGEHGPGGGGEEGASDPPSGPTRQARRTTARVSVMCSRLVAEAPFLVDGPTMAAAAAADSPAAAEGIKAECILRAVGCTSDADVAELVEYFFTPRAGGDGDEDDDDADAAAESESTRDGALALARGQCTVPPGGVVRTVLRFVEARAAAEREAAAATDPFGEGGGGARHVRPGPSADVVALLRRAEEEGGVSAPPSAQGTRGGGTAPPPRAAAGAGAGGGSPSSNPPSADGQPVPGGAHDTTPELGEGLDEVSRAQQQEAEYWSKLVNTVPPRTVRVWRVLEQGLSKYVATLSRRSKVMEEVSGLKAQNAELKGLLQQYLGARVNKELQVPPTQTIRGAGGGGGSLASRGGGGGLGVSGLRMATPSSTASSRAGRGTTREGKR